MNLYQILQWDTKFFGFKVALITKGCLSLDSFAKAYLDMENEGIKLIYWPASTSCKYQSDIVEKFNGLFVDLKTTYSVTLDKFNTNLGENKNKTELLKSDKPDKYLLGMAVQCGEFSRYKLDINIPANKFEELYKIWLVKSFNGEMADDVIVAKNDNVIAGFITVQCRDETGYIGLVGVHNNFRGKGIGGGLLQASLKYFTDKNCKKVIVVTQGKNEAACKLYEKYRFNVQNQTNFYHFWVKK
jgi:dTDP-4-amino-4,6-dideoxy-D-galactose acyltransferase